MKISCKHCGGPAIINSRQNITPLVARLYVSCKNVECQAGQTFRLSYERTIQQPVSDQLTMAHELFANMDPAERKKLIEVYS